MGLRFVSAVVLLCAGLPVLRGESPGVVAIRDAKIVTVSGATIEKGVIVLKDGLIADVGATASVPEGAWVIDGAGLTVYPGLIDALSTWGTGPAAVRPGAAPATSAPPVAVAQGGVAPRAQGPRSWGPEDRPGTTSWVKAADDLQPADRRLEAARSAGFTTAVTFPRQGLVAGHGAVVNLAGETAGEMVLDDAAGLYMTLNARSVNGFPNSLMGVLAYFRQLWLDAAYYRQAKAAYDRNPSGVPRPAYDRALEGVLAARRVLLPAGNRVELERMARFAAELKTPAILYGAQEAYAVAADLKKLGVAVIVNVKWPTKPRDADPELPETLRALTVRDRAPSSPEALARAGVKFAFTSDGNDAPKDVLRAVKRSIDNGLSKDDAIRALTLSAAEIYGVANRLGSLDKGKIANLAVVKGDIFDEDGKVRMVFIDGRKYDPAPEAPASGAGAARRPSGAAANGEVRQ